MIDLLEYLNWFATCLLIVRLGTASLIISSHSLLAVVPVRLRIGMSLAFAALLVPFAAAGGPVSFSTAEMVPLLIGEALCGAVFGFGVRLWLVGAEICSQLIGQTSGLGILAFARGSSATMVRFFQLLWLCTFLVIGGHRMTVGRLLDSFQSCPLGSFVYDAHTPMSISKLLTLGFGFGIQAGIPIVAALLLAMGISLLLGRMIPQVHVLATSTGISAMLLMALLWIGSGPMLRALEIQVPDFLTAVSQAVSVTTPGG